MSDPIAAARAEGRSLLSEVESKQLLADAGIRVTQSRLATSAADAATIAAEIGFPVVLKVSSTEIAHKSDVGGVLLGLEDEAAVRDGYERIIAAVGKAAPGASVEGVSVQEMAKPGTEVVIGTTTDPQFGPVMMFGLGGIFVEVLKDVAFRIVPLEERDARQMVREIRGFPVLAGVRGQAPADLAALESMILQLSQFIEQHPEIAELDLNPVLAYADGAIAVDARVVLAAQSVAAGA
jgi:acetate---CoA ligase (ADP-forming) subunit beta